MEKMNFFDKSSEATILKDKSDIAQKLNGRVEPAFGIDLGTTNSAISVIINNNKPEPIILTSGKTWNTIVSGIDETKRIQEEAKKKREEDSKRLDVIKQQYAEKMKGL